MDSADSSPVTWLKGKYTRPKPKGTYKSGSNTSGVKSKRLKRREAKPKRERIHIKIIGPNGKARWEWKAQ